jgi:hypothetical protein
MIPSGPSEHLFAVTLGPCVLDGYGSEPQAVIVSFSSIKPGLAYDEACTVLAGSHPFITRDSFVYYREPRIYPVSVLEKRVHDNEWRGSAPCSEELLNSVLDGFRRSNRLPRYFNEILDIFGV